MNFRRHGEAPWCVVVLHGGPGAPGCAAGLCRGIVEQFGVIEHLQKARSIDKLLEEIHSVLNECSIEKPVLIGHSFGAWLALLFAARYPHCIRKVILVGCGPLEQQYLPQLIKTREDRKQAGATDTDNFCPLPGSGGDMLYFDEEQHIALMKEATQLRKSGELLRHAKSVECPIVAFHGLYDPHPIEGIRVPMQGQSNFRLIELERCGHDPWKEQWARETFFNELLFEIHQ